MCFTHGGEGWIFIAATHFQCCRSLPKTRPFRTAPTRTDNGLRSRQRIIEQRWPPTSAFPTPPLASARRALVLINPRIGHTAPIGAASGSRHFTPHLEGHARHRNGVRVCPSSFLTSADNGATTEALGRLGIKTPGGPARSPLITDAGAGAPTARGRTWNWFTWNWTTWDWATQA